MSNISYAFEGALYCAAHVPQAAETRCTSPSEHADENGACTKNCHGYGPNYVSPYEEHEDGDVCDTCNGIYIDQQYRERQAQEIMNEYKGAAKLRHVIFKPYSVFKPYSAGPAIPPQFSLWTFDTGKSDAAGRTQVAYLFKMSTYVWHSSKRLRGHTRTIFAGTDFYCSPLHAIDSDACVKSLMTFITLRPGDTDAEYFKDYSEAQRDFAEQHAEALSLEVLHRFGE